MDPHTGPDGPHAISRPSPSADPARSPVALLGELERAAAATPWDARIWNTALTELREGRVTDGDIGASATTAGARPLAVAVVSAYSREDLAVLRRCHETVLAQTYPCRHIMVADGFARDEIDAWDVEHVRLDHTHADYGDTPRAIGGERARALGCEAIAYLDGDNSFRPHHVESMVSRCRATGAAVVFSGRTRHLPDGQMLPKVKAADSRRQIDTSCLFLAGDALTMASVWLAYPRPLSTLGDKLVVQILQGRGLAFACTGALTVRYTVNRAVFYRALGLPVPAAARPNLDITPVAAYCRSLSAREWRELDATLGFPAAAFLREFLESRGATLEEPR